MNRSSCNILCTLCLLGTLATAVAGQPPGDAASDKLVAQGDAFRSKGKLTEALSVYRQSAKAGNVNGAFSAGDMLFTQGRADSGRERILKLSEGMGYLFFAATNHHPQACFDLSVALQNGIGVHANPVCAYAWMEVAAHTTAAYTADLDRLVVQMEPDDVLKAQKVARAYLAGHWPDHVASPVELGDPRLQIQGVTGTGSETLIVLNGGTLTVGESVNVMPAGKLKSKSGEILAVSCREIGTDYALVAVAGEPSLKMLAIEPR